MSGLTGFSLVTRRIIKERAGSEAEHVRCEVCGVWTDTGAIHHRRARGMGSTKRPESNLPSNGLSVCNGCHEMIESWRADALKKGWLLRQWDDPASTPVQLWDGLYLLSDDGSRVGVLPVEDDDDQRLTWRTV